jgi:16S rRNA (guanine(966)-N(2))-methyltransferase RsmD
VRPTSERTRQAFFNIVGDRIHGARFLDLFAGSGIFSFEAVSRGASSATAVDHDRSHIAAIARTAEELKVPVRAVKGDVIDSIPRLEGPFDVIYADPPYDFADYDRLISAIERVERAPDAIVAVEHRKRSNPFRAVAGTIRPQRRVEHGEVWITFFA